MIKLYNTLTKKKEEFKPIIKGNVSMYNCGPTVYNYAHIGNLRSYILADLLRRTFEYEGLKVKQVINITDVGHLIGDTDDGEDKIEKMAKKELKEASDIAKMYTEAFIFDLKALNIETKKTLFPKATEHIKEQIELIKILKDKGYAYKTSDGVYFDTAKFKDYGKLGNINIAGIQAGARIAMNFEKRNITDFALWKFSQQSDKRQQEWQSPWGVGFPGWHIECSAMSVKYLGQPFDVHTGGIDHIPIHHNNEIAQSEGATGKPLANYWLHNEFVNTNTGEKMAKSVDNFLRLKTLIDKNYSPIDYKYLLLTSHYRTPTIFSYEALDGAKTAYKKLVKYFAEIKTYGKVSDDYQKQFKNFINDDLDTPQALALIWKLIKDKDISDEDKKSTIADFDTVLGLNIEKEAKKVLEKKTITKIPKEISVLIKKREEARKNKDWKKSDELRKKIEATGYLIKDTDTGPKIEKN